MTLDELNENPTGPIYVTNTSMANGKNGADIFITIYVGNQSVAAVLNVPLTWLPISLTEQAPRAAILGSQHFLRALSSGVLKITSKEEADAILITPRAAKELERIRQIKSSVQAAIRNPNADEFKLTIDGEDPKQEKVSVSTSFFDEGAVNASFRAWVNKTNTQEVDEAINSAQIRGDFTVEELQFFSENTRHQRIRNGLNKRLTAMTAVTK